MIILDYGESALLVNFEQKIDTNVNEQVIRLHKELAGISGISYTIPAYASLTVGFDAQQIGSEELKALIYATNLSARQHQAQEKTFVIPVCYEDAFAPDMAEVCELTGLDKEKIIELHTSTTYRVFMLGFVAGFAYLGTLPEQLQCPRKQTPRKIVPKGAVGLAGFQTGIYPTEAPGGWQLIGQSPVKTFDAQAEVPVILAPGDQVQFKAIGAAAYEDISDSVRFGSYKWEVQYG